jgi:hypothetical protein
MIAVSIPCVERNSSAHLWRWRAQHSSVTGRDGLGIARGEAWESHARGVTRRALNLHVRRTVVTTVPTLNPEAFDELYEDLCQQQGTIASLYDTFLNTPCA